jgi:hypothetical protein
MQLLLVNSGFASGRVHHSGARLDSCHADETLDSGWTVAPANRPHTEASVPKGALGAAYVAFALPGKTDHL